MKNVAKALLFDSTGKILVLRRSVTHPHFAFHLDFPGGEVEAGESEAEAVAREILEEAGIVVDPSSLELVHQRQHSDTTEYLVFVGTLAQAQPPATISWEHDQYEWLTHQQILARPLPPNVDSYYQTALQYLQSRSSRDDGDS